MEEGNADVWTITPRHAVNYGDVTLSEQWRMLGSVEAANGMLLFGWSTAFIFEVMRWVWKLDSLEADTKATSVS